MAGKSKIEWTEQVWNPVIGCTKITQGCKNCYAERMFKRLSRISSARSYYGKSFETVQCLSDRLGEPLTWKKPRTVFVNSMGDLFHKDVPFNFVDEVMVIMSLAFQHNYIILTKRPGRMREYFEEYRQGKRHVYRLLAELMGVVDPGTQITVENFSIPSNIWLGVSVSDQADADCFIPELLEIPAAVKVISAEPLLGPVNLTKWAPSLQWIICGGESGPAARPMNPDWALSLRDQCAAAKVPFFFKQWGEYIHPWEMKGELNIQHSHNCKCKIVHLEGKYIYAMHRVGKKKAGHLLEGKEYIETPKQGAFNV